MDIECNICRKRYKNIDALGRHRNKCILRNPNHDILVKETEKMPYTRKLLTALLERISKLEKRVEANTKYITREKRKINIIDYLNDGEKAMFASSATDTAADTAADTALASHPTFIQFKRNIVMDKQTLKEYLHSNPIMGLVNIVKKNLDRYDESSVPIRCFAQKRSMYVRNIQEPLNREPLNREPLNREPLNREPLNREPLNREPLNREPLNREYNDVCLYYWVEVTEWTEYERLIIHIQQKLLKEYEKMHNNKLHKTSTNMTDDSHSSHTQVSTQDKYFENIKKILMTDKSSDTVCSRFKQQLYEALKREIDVKYEIVY